MRFRVKIYLAHTDRNPSVKSIVSDKGASNQFMIKDMPPKETQLSKEMNIQCLMLKMEL